MKPKISFVLPIYNAENFLKYTLDCIKNQTLQDIEAICIDDGSNDKSFEILQEYAKSDNRFIAIKQHNQGTIVTKKNALKIARGEYISFLDHDDEISLDFCKKMYNLAKKDNSDIVITGTIFLENKIESSKFIPTLNDNCYIDYFFSPGSTLDLWAKIYKRDFFILNTEKIFANISATANIPQDLPILFNLLLNAKKVSCIKEALHIYKTINANSMTFTDNFLTEGTVFFTMMPIKETLISLNLYDKFKIKWITFFYETIIYCLSLNLKTNNNSKKLFECIIKTGEFNDRNLEILKQSYQTYNYLIYMLYSSNIKIDCFANIYLKIKKLNIKIESTIQNFLAFSLIYSCIENNIKSVNIYGTGSGLSTIITLAKEKNIKITNIIDSRADKEEIVKFGKKVITLQEAYKNKQNIPIFIASYTYLNEITSTINHFKQKNNIDIKIINERLI